MKDIVNISQELFNKIRSRFTDVSLGDQSGKNTSDPSNARFFNFNYLSHGKKDFGNVTISLIDEKSLKVYFNKDIATNLDTEDQDDWFKFLRDMRKFAKRSVLGFDTRDINRSSLELRDIMQQSANQGIQTTDEDIQESKMYGTKRKSYDHVGETRLIIKHINMVDEEKRGSRTRNIDAVFVETAEGERYKLRTTNLHGARAIGQHVAQGGTITDDRTEEIYNMVIEMQQLSKFLRATRNTSTFEDADIPHMVEAVRVRYTEVQRGLKTMRGPKGYNKFWDGYAPSENMDLDSSDALKERFTTRFLDQRIEEALPFVYNAYHKMTEASKLTQSTTDEIDSWADSIAIPGEVKETKIQEGTWHLPSTSEEVEIFKKIMSKPLMFGNEGDRPYLLKASNETFSAMSYVIGQLKKEIKIPFGINYLWDPVATVSLACVAEADFAREVFTGVYDSDMGLWEPKAAEALKLRSDLGNKKLKLLFNINAEFAAPLGDRDISQKAKSAVFSSTADAICVSGPITGESVDISNLILAKEAVKDLVPVFANTGVKFETLDEILKVADGCVVGTSLKYKGNTWNQVDGERVRKFMDKVNDIRDK